MGIDEVLAAAGRVGWPALGERDLCDACLGRLVGKAGHGFTNAERGRALREAYVVRRGGACWLCRELLSEIPKFADLVTAKLGDWDHRTFLIGSKVDPEVAEREETLWVELGASEAEPIKAEINREVGKLVGARTGKDVDFQRPDVTAVVDTQYDVVDLQVAPLFLYGRYRKFARNVPQTRWPCNRCWGKGCDRCGGRGKMYETSVEEVVAAEVMKQTGGTGHALHGRGREDVDALMLGNGRPFVLEVTQPRRRTVDLGTVGDAVNRSRGVAVTDLRPSSRDEVVALKEERGSATYHARVRFVGPVEVAKLKEGLAALAHARIAQRTPIRVTHRRSDRIRHRTLGSVELIAADGREAEVLVTAPSGTYVKEVLHGDAGRTVPNLADRCGMPCEVFELDVVRIHDEG